MTAYIERLAAIAEALVFAPFVVTILVLAVMAIFWIYLAERHRPR